MTYSVAVDVGGTFTDVVLMDTATGEHTIAKTPTTDDQTDGVITGVLRAASEAGVDLGHIANLHYGSTAALNALLTRQGATVGLIVTSGYRQILHLARSQTPGPLVGWLNWMKPDPLAPLDLTWEVAERVGADGKVQIPLDEETARAALTAAAAAGVEALAVVFLHSYANPDHERKVKELAAQVAPELQVTLSSDVLPEYREYERATTAVVNTYIRPSVAGALEKFDTRLEAQGLACNINVVRSDGGLMTSRAAVETPVETILSGPSGGVAGALAVARAAGIENILSFDMGGTSTDVSICIDGEALISRETVVDDFPIRSPSLDVRSIGAGGGSIAFIPEVLRGLRVGPESAGADPGPVCYGRGGTRPTVTDANLILGRLPAGLLGGELELDEEAASTAIGALAASLDVDVLQAAQAIVDIADEKMAGALRVISVERGLDPQDFTLVAFGGAGPLHGNALAALLGCYPVLVPPSPGVLSAYGFHVGGHRNTFSKTIIREVDEHASPILQSTVDEMSERAQDWLAGEGLTDAGLSFSADMRFLRQGYEIEVPFAAEETGPVGIEAILGRFRADHQRLYGFVPEAAAEIVTVRVEAKAPARLQAAEPLELVVGDGGQARVATKRAFHHGRHLDAAVYDRRELRAGDRLPGPAVVVQQDATTYVHPGHDALVDAFLNLRIAREGGS